MERSDKYSCVPQQFLMVGRPLESASYWIVGDKILIPFKMPRQGFERSPVGDSYGSDGTAGKIRRMRNSFIGIPSRIAFLLCGIISLALGRVYRSLVGLDRASEGSWSVFWAILMAVGGLAVLLAILPGSWISKALRVESTKHSLVPIKMMGAFAAASYLIIAGLSFGIVGFSVASLGSRLSPEFVFSVCPACALRITVQPSLSTVLLFLAPLSAAPYGALGGELGYLSVVLHKND